MSRSADLHQAPLRVAVLGAGAVAPLQQVLGSLPPRSGFALVVVCQDGDSLATALRASSALPVTEVAGRIRLITDQVFVVPSECDAVLQRDELLISKAGEPRAPLDKLLRSLSDEHGGHGIGVVLGGPGNDGALGVKRLKEVGGLTIAQRPESERDEMSRSAIATGMIDLVLPLPEIAARLATFGRSDVDPPPPAEDSEPRATETGADTLRDILTLVRIRSGHDFGPYKRATLYRRVSRRIQVCQCESITDYLHYLREHPGELALLLRDFLISVTNFFRDRLAFDALESLVIPKLFIGKTSGDQVRVWVTGCATGEEAYSMAILLCEHASKLVDPPQLQIFATDIDEESLAEARLGRYPVAIASDVSPERLQRFFTPDHDHYRVSKELREIILFSPHNLLRDPPFSRLDLISCRNLMIYLNREAQDRVLTVFRFGLRSDGFLFLGSSESADNPSLFLAADAKHRIFVRQSSSSRLGGEAIVPTGRWQPPLPPPAPAPVIDRLSAGELHHRVVEKLAPPSVLINHELDIVHISERAGRLLQITGGEPTRQLLRLIHPGLRADLRTAIYAARQPGRNSDTRRVRFDDDGTPRFVEIRVRTVEDTELSNRALLVMFDELDASPGDASSSSTAQGLEPVMRELEDELRHTREQLRTTIEQYETSLEELKASNEELQAINEELRSATEELETSKEELQSVNEELTTLNHELKLKVDEVSHANSDLQNLMTSTDIGVMFLDRSLHIKRFTPRAQDLFNVIPGDIGRPFAHLTHRLAAENVPQLAHSVLQTLRTIESKVRSHDGHQYLMRLLPYRSLEDRIDGVVLTFVDVTDLHDAIDARRRSEAALLTSEQRLRFALRSAPMMVLHQDDQLRTTWGYVLGKELESGSLALHELLAPGHAERFGQILQQVLTSGSGQRAELDVIVRGERRTYDFRIERSDQGIDAVGFDITPSKLAEAALLDADRRKDEFLATLSHELRNPLTPLKVALDIAKLADNDVERLRHSWAIMERQVAQLSQLVDDLLDLSRITQGKIELDRRPIDPVRIAEAALEATRPLIQQRNQRLTLELPETTTHVLGDQARLTQVLINLVNNAVKYTPAGGHITLSLAVDLPGKRLRITVGDDGDGIPVDMLPRIFEMFVQYRDPGGHSRNGLGIGLNLVQRIVELHGGRVSAFSDGPGRGSKFVIELPLVHDGSAS